jgi:hypothetical protein
MSVARWRREEATNASVINRWTADARDPASHLSSMRRQDRARLASKAAASKKKRYKNNLAVVSSSKKPA